MYRQHLLEMLERYLARHPDEMERVEQVCAFVQDHKDCFLRTCRKGHVTGSAWLLAPGRDRVLLTHHRKLGRWMQLGGHCDGEPEVHRVALREAQEESGMWELDLHVEGEGPVPIDVDVHEIPSHGDEPRHLHYDVRFVVVARPGQAPRRSRESRELRWWSYDEIESVLDEDSLRRMARKARLRLGPAG